MDATTEELLAGAGLPGAEVAAWLAADETISGDYRRDADAFSRRWRMGADLLNRLPRKLARSAGEAVAATAILTRERASRERFLATHVETIYRALSQDYGAFKRVEVLVSDAAAFLPGLTPDARRLAADDGIPQGHKDGIEIDQGIFLAQVLAHPAAGMHLCHAMLLPRPESLERLAHFRAHGTLALDGASLERQGKASHLTMRNRRFLNAEDESTIDDLEIAADLACLDPASDIGILRGDTVDHPKFAGRRLFSAGINLTHLYHGRISYLWYIRREMGFVNKLFRGVARPDISPDEIYGGTVEKPWVAVVDGFAIGGGCQILLAVDYILAASDAYMTLPARKEGIIPGASNMRLWRFTGDRIAREAILYGRRLDCDTPAGRLVCDEVVPPDSLDAALEAVVDGFTSSGVVSAAGNRRAIRIGQEPLDLFRRYMAVYAREQAYCHFSPALIANLERNWSAQNRAP
ncbi:MAG TPA: enoyl-CoA hydratase-related protein [Stellaceae bacterium]